MLYCHLASCYWNNYDKGSQAEDYHWVIELLKALRDYGWDEDDEVDNNEAEESDFGGDIKFLRRKHDDLYEQIGADSKGDSYDE